MLKAPSSRRSLKEVKKPNLVPILDAVFIFIFFLLMSSSFVKIYEISSNIPLVSNSIATKKKNDLFLTLKINRNRISLYRGSNLRHLKSFNYSSKNSISGNELEQLHQALMNIKRKNLKIDTLIIEPHDSVSYQMIIQVMDAANIIQKTDIGIYKYDKKTASDIKLKTIFSNIVFGNIKS